MSGELFDDIDTWLALPQDERDERTRVWKARREAEATHGPRTPGDIGLRKAQVPIVSRVTGRRRPDGTVEPLDPPTGAPSPSRAGQPSTTRHPHTPETPEHE
ncbi:hypothetical protein EBM89_16835 [Cellulomonas triticagri]|uniref:Uncharacterized protein n=1 Tax=Cellulomonas triticagri TaxID=2483352 RepID=A0A3M2IZD2_9CELL|nr:hypothetical protein EBM89_16835 [Cellulomonas triticagri]